MKISTRKERLRKALMENKDRYKITKDGGIESSLTYDDMYK